MSLPIEEYFKYHPALTPERIANHEAVNNAALAFAKTIEEKVQDVESRRLALAGVQQARMFANQGITVDELLTLQN